MQSSFPFVIVVDDVTEFEREGVLSGLQYADDLTLTSETIEELRNKFRRWKEVFESKDLKDNLQKNHGDWQWRHYKR